MEKFIVGEVNRQAYVVVELGDNDLYSKDFTDKGEALTYVEETGRKCYIICVEYRGGGDYEITSEAYT